MRLRRTRLGAAIAALLLAGTALPSKASSQGNDIFARRDEWQRTADMISALGDVRGRRIADIAAGTGYLTKALSRRVGPSGRAFITTPVSQWLVVARRPQR
ncbi:MAG TPA: hypothetical protein VGP95_13475 [Gemmatimonadaceae bacterium]|jgi:ubiquinone/menaquinone biosynthesis C-methylase UbiE|nr:hypothetical protein [Gemmatimonadaceae bacterium]